MIDVGLTRAEERQLYETLKDSHSIRIQVDILNNNEQIKGSLTSPQSMVLDGAVQFDSSADVTRTLNLTLLDPHRKLRFQPDTAAQGALFADRFIRVRYGVYDPDLGWVDVPVFWGPLTHFEHIGPQVILEAQGKEALLLDPHLAVQGFTIAKGTDLDDAIKKVARRSGESRFTIPDLKWKLPQPYVIAPEAEPWRVINGGQGLEGVRIGDHRDNSKDKDDEKKKKRRRGLRPKGLLDYSPKQRHAYYDGRGRLCVRRSNKDSCFTFNDQWLLEHPSVSYDTLETRNYVRVSGRKPKGGKKRVSAVAKLPQKNPMSPASLRRSGEPRFMAVFVETDLQTEKECAERARDILDRQAVIGVEPSFSCLPIPTFEEGDWVTLRSGGYHIKFPLRQWTLPLTNDAMEIGSNKHVRPRRHRRRRKGKKRR